MQSYPEHNVDTAIKFAFICPSETFRCRGKTAERVVKILSSPLPGSRSF